MQFLHSFDLGGSVAEWFVRWTTKLAIWVRSRVAAGLPTGYSGLGTVSSSIGLGWIVGEVMARTVDSAGNKSFHPYQVGTFVDYPR